MVTLKSSGKINEYVGMSSDTKPVFSVPNGSTFYEMDVDATWHFDAEGRSWYHGGDSEAFSISGVNAVEGVDSLELTVLGGCLNESDTYRWYLKLDSGAPIMLSSIGTEIILDGDNFSAYQAADEASVAIVVGDYTSVDFPLKEPDGGVDDGGEEDSVENTEGN